MAAEQRTPTLQYFWYNDFNLRQAFEVAAAAGVRRGQELQAIPAYWSDDLVPHEPCTMHQTTLPKFVWNPNGKPPRIHLD
jgi:hypothetical protein